MVKKGLIVKFCFSLDLFVLSLLSFLLITLNSNNTSIHFGNYILLEEFRNWYHSR